METNLSVFTPINIFSFKPLSTLNTWFHYSTVKRILKKFGERPTILWIYHFDFPDLENFIKKFTYDVLIYDCVDEYSFFPEYQHQKFLNKGVVHLIKNFDENLKIKLNQNGLYGASWVKKREEWLVNVADLLFASAPNLTLKLKTMAKELGKAEEIVNYVPNAGDYARFKESINYKEQVPEDMKALPSPRITVVGAIDNFKMNIKLLERCASQYPHYSFVLIGPKNVSDPDLDLSKLESLKNVHFLGLKKNSELPYYHAGTDVYLIPYNLNEYTVGGCFPVKFHDALSSGLPVIVTNLPAYEPFEEVCYIARNDDEFVEDIKKALEEDSDLKIKARMEVAKQNSWDGKVDRQLVLIRETLRVKER